MSWWRRRPEVRGEAGYTETRLLEQFTRAISGNVRHGALGGLQCAASAIARAFAAAEVEGDDGLLDPTTLYSMAFDLVREGQSLWLLDASTGRLRLSRASTGSDVYQGSAEHESWTYRLTLPGPSITTTVRASAEQVVHIRHAIKTGLRLALPETVAAGGGSGRASAPLTDWKPYRLGPEYMAGGVELHALTLQETAGVCGLPAPMVPGADAAGPAAREAFRQFVALTVQPLGRILEAEVSRVLERPVRLTHHELASADVASRARAFKVLIENDIEQDRALALVGWS